MGEARQVVRRIGHPGIGRFGLHPRILILVSMILQVGPLRGVALAQFQGAWISAAGTISTTVWVSHQRNSAWFCGQDRLDCRPGDRTEASPLARTEESRAVSSGVRVQASPTDWLDLSLDVPYHDVTYKKFADGVDDPTDDLEVRGIGDLRMTTRLGGRRGAWALSAGHALSIPTGNFSISAFLIPIGQGSVAHDAFLEAGRSLGAGGAALEAGVLYRLRKAYRHPAGFEVRWGNELHARLSGSGRVHGGVLARAEARTFVTARRTTDISGEPAGERRVLLEAVPGLSFSDNRMRVDAWLSIPVLGRNTPSDPTAGLAVTLSWKKRSAPE